MSTRTSSRQVSKLEVGDRIMLMGIRVAVVQSTSPLPDAGVLRYVDTGDEGERRTGRRQEPVYWHEVCLAWEDSPGSPEFYVNVEGNKFIALRDTNPDHPTKVQ